MATAAAPRFHAGQLLHDQAPEGVADQDRPGRQAIDNLLIVVGDAVDSLCWRRCPGLARVASTVFGVAGLTSRALRGCSGWEPRIYVSGGRSPNWILVYRLR